MNYKKFLVNTGNNMSVTDLDFSKEEDFNMLMGWMHGEDVCKEKFPLFYERFVKAAAVPGRMKEEQGFKDGISLSLPLYDTKRDVYVVQGKTCLTEEPQFILQRIEVRGAGDELIAQTSDADMFQDYTGLRMEIPAAQMKREMELLYFVVWFEDGGLYGKTAARKIDALNAVGPGIASFTLEKPVPGDGRDTVVVVYNRVPQSHEKNIDYNYAEKITGGKQRTYLEVEGTVKMMDGAVIRAVDYDNIELRLNCPGRGNADYGKTITADVFPLLKLPEKDRAGKDFKIEFVDSWKDWNVDLPTSRLPIKDKADFEMIIPYELTNGLSGNLIASSTIEESGNHIFHASKLYLLWGCLKEDTCVNMADGSRQKIQYIHPGDAVMGHDGPCEVRNIYSGPEDTLLCIETEQGARISCTESHVFATEQGPKKAGELCGADRLMTPVGPVEISGIYQVSGATVYSLEFEKAGFFYAEDILTGDFRMQNQVFRAVRNSSPDMRLLAKELKQLKEWMKE